MTCYTNISVDTSYIMMRNCDEVFFDLVRWDEDNIPLVTDWMSIFSRLNKIGRNIHPSYKMEQSGWNTMLRFELQKAYKLHSEMFNNQLNIVKSNMPSLTLDEITEGSTPALRAFVERQIKINNAVYMFLTGVNTHLSVTRPQAYSIMPMIVWSAACNTESFCDIWC